MKFIMTAAAVAFAIVSTLQADDNFDVATLDIPGNALNIIHFTVPTSGSPVVAITKTIALPSGADFLVRNAGCDHIYTSAGNQIVDLNVSASTTTSTVTTARMRRLQITNPNCLCFGVSPIIGKPAFQSSPLPALAPAEVANPATTRFSDLTALSAGGDAFLAAVREVTGTDHGEVHRLNASSCPPTLVSTFDIGANKAAFAIAPISPTTAFVSVLGEKDLQIVNFTAATIRPAGIVNLPPKPRLVRRLDSLPNRHYVIDLDGQISFLDSGATPPTILQNLVAGGSPSVALVDPANKWLVVLDRTKSDARLFAISGNNVDPTPRVAPMTVPVNDAVMLP